MLRLAAVLLAVVLLGGCGGGSDPAAQDATGDRSTTNPDGTSAPPAADTGNPPAGSAGADACAAAAAAFDGDAADAIERGDIDSAIEAYGRLADHAPAEVAGDAEIVRDGLAKVRSALSGSGLDDEKLAAFFRGDAGAISSLGPSDLVALQRIGEDLRAFYTSTDYISAAQRLGTYYAGSCAR